MLSLLVLRSLAIIFLETTEEAAITDVSADDVQIFLTKVTLFAPAVKPYKPRDQKGRH